MSNRYKEEGEKSGPDTDTTKIKTEHHGHTLRFRYQFRKYELTCNAPVTVQDRLQTDFYFKAICKKNQKGGQKELVIQREQLPRAAVTPHFPCCLLSDNELLDIKFIISDGNSGRVKTQNHSVLSTENFVSFYIKTKGEKNIRMLMKNKELKTIVDYVCVYAVKGEAVRAALKRDGRFNTVLFKKGALKEEKTESIMHLSNLVDHLDGKQFQVIVSPHPSGSQEPSQESSQEMSHESGETVKDEKSEVSEPPQEKKNNKDSTSAQEKETETPEKEKKSRKYPDLKEIPNTQEILSLLRAQHGELLKTLKERENLKNNVEVKRFFRKEYDKSAQSFSEVKRVKQLMELSDSVCQIRNNGFGSGTGFLLFDRYVLTNAHVVGGLVPCTPPLKHSLTAVFDFEGLQSEVKVIPVKENVVAFLNGKDDMGNYLDFALLELSTDGKSDLPELVRRYSPPRDRGGVCIIGHPEGGVKRMDPCFIIAKDDIKQEAKRYSEKNQNLNVFRVITEQCLVEDKEKRKSQIMYHSCFFHGSSGSPVFDEYCNLIGVHTGGYFYEGQRGETRSVMEYGLPMFPILVQIFIQCSKKERADVLQYFESQNNMEDILQVAKEQLQRSSQPMDIP
ncbi:serine protease FAM111A-like [Pangasianodon hypophthalmus]|uniref:serine protease FAM111A-like n=1 Tax=Pangasianodon hypophthalmus TaxID=310915 RepID=UPI000EFF5484|nr:serine protease FAM111A-like [Pangasianodon hypophthalmus]